MKRDPDLIREVLFFFEERESTSIVKPGDVEFEGYDDRVVGYHMILLCEADYLSCETTTSRSTEERVINAFPFRLTWKGHEFLDAARNDSVWEKAKDTLRERGITVAFGVLQTLLTQLTKEHLGLT